jgi:DNA (cytosine-5)-methyltransferase 1
MRAQDVVLSMIKKGLRWSLKDLKTIPPNGHTVFSMFHCGGGSTMGYKLAGYDVLGGVDIDPDMMAIYRSNHKPKHSYLMGVGEFNKLGQSAFDKIGPIDILDGSPPCSSFSIAGARSRKWGQESHFREGQAVQVLDDLFFDFIESARLLQPKIVVAENVVGLITGKAKGYVKEIIKAFDTAGYRVQVFKLCAARMGVPQRRRRVFFVCSRKDLNFSALSLRFEEPEIPFKEIDEGKCKGYLPIPKNTAYKDFWAKTKPGSNFSSVHPKKHLWNYRRVSSHRPLPTITSTGASNVNFWHSKHPRLLSRNELLKGFTFPHDYDFGKENVGYVVGMSVPPFMMQRLSDQIYEQWLKL